MIICLLFKIIKSNKYISIYKKVKISSVKIDVLTYFFYGILIKKVKFNKSSFIITFAVLTLITF